MEINLQYEKISKKYIEVSFRNLVKDIPSTTYATHGLYMYPAKFIPQVVRFAINRFTFENEWVFDPFAGYGTVGIEASLTGRNFVLWDLNPILDVISKASLFKNSISIKDMEIDFNFGEKFFPRWKNLDYWHPKEFLDVLSRVWGYFHFQVPEELKPIIAIPLLKITRYFSFSDEKIPKLYKSKYAVEKVRKLLLSNWKKRMISMYLEEAKKVVEKIKMYQELKPKDVKYEIRAGVDSLSLQIDREVSLLITSPPYLQAQEYIRSFKLELFWLGYDEKTISKLAKLEIPYRKKPLVDVYSDTYERYKKIVESFKHPKLLEIYESYFKSLVLFLNNNHKKIKTMAIFVGPVKIRTVRIPIDEILREHLEFLGWKHEITYIDKIVSRRLFNSRINPSTGLNDERTPTEHLLIMSRE